MNTKAKSVSVYELRILDWEYFNNKKPTKQDNIYQWNIINSKTKEKIFFNTPAKLILAIEKLQKKIGQ